MAATDEVQEQETPRDLWLKPIGAFFKACWLFADVGTLMIRLLFNTIVHDDPQGKVETLEGRARD